ncbi:MAG TPA: DinB family protein [Flavobacterium sp.]|nr:DinB family protein [Flavobacterium sp.]
METTATAQVITPEHLLKHWQGHRNLTRRIVDAFPEKDFFEFSIGGMRTAAQLMTELLAIGAPGTKAIANRDDSTYTENTQTLTTKAEYLQLWDEATEEINHYWNLIELEDFGRMFKLFGQYENYNISNIFYFIDNEIHHRGQMYVYLRALGVAPPAFYER